MRSLITTIAITGLLIAQLSSAASAAERMFVTSLMPGDITAARYAGEEEKATGTAETDGYKLYEVDLRVPRHLSIQSRHLLHGNLAEGPYTSRRRDMTFTSVVDDFNADRLSGTMQLGAAALTSFAAHELGHVVIADTVGARGVNLQFFKSRDGSFFLGSSTVTSLPSESRLPFSMGGEVFADYAFEYALESYRDNPTIYNKSVMLLSGLDFLRYTIYSFYIVDPHDNYDPVAVTNYTGFSKGAILGVAVAKTVMNAYRIYSGEDRFIPYFDVDTRSATFNVLVRF